MVRASERLTVRFAGNSLEYQLLAPDFHRKLEMVWVEIEPGANSGDRPFVNPSDEIILVLEGTIEAIIGDSTEILESGDAIYYEAGTLGKISNIGSQKAIVISAMTPPRV